MKKVKENSSYLEALSCALQQELAVPNTKRSVQLRKVLIYQLGESKRETKLKGLWKGIDVTEEEIEEAKRTVFKDAYNFEE